MSRFGFSTEPSSGDFLGIIKFDARAGRMFRIDRVDTGNGFQSEPIDITNTFKALVDLENVEVGWINFDTGGAPDFRLVPMGSTLPDRPGPKHKNGIRIILKLAKDCGGDKPIREIAGVSKAFLNGIEKVFDEYDAQRGENPGKLPILMLEGTTPIKSGSGGQQSTNYVPKFKIIGWAARGDLVFQRKGSAPVQAAQSNGSSHAAVPPATGSTQVKAPAPIKQPEPEFADADFG
jgi:hypothetical protein